MLPSVRRPRLAYLVTHPLSAKVLLAGQLAYMREAGFDVTVISAPGPELDVVREREGVNVLSVPMERPLAALSDARSLGALISLLRRIQPDIVNAGTTKAGLLGMLAARAVATPIRLYVLRGLRMETVSGALRAVLGATERIASACAHEVIAVSRSLREAFVHAGCSPAHKVRVLGDGSSNGVETARFAPTDALRAEAAALRARLGIAADAKLIGFVGRLSRDKGIVELLDSFAMLRERDPGVRLMLVSAEITGEDVPAEFTRRLPGMPGVVVVPRVEDVRPYLICLNALAFPSHREGFPNVVLEAAALGVPAVGYRVTGVVDAIEHGVTGTLVRAHDVGAFTEALAAYLGDSARARAEGEAARARAHERFARRVVWRHWAELYSGWLSRLSLPRATGV